MATYLGESEASFCIMSREAAQLPGCEQNTNYLGESFHP